MGALETLFGYIGDFTWGWALVPFLVVLGLFFTVASGGVQFRFFKRMFRVLWEKQEGAKGHVSSRAALLLSVGGRAGGGNIAGVAVAITLGGPGAVFWMWMIALVGMATSLFECTLAQLFKRAEADGTYRGGPGRYIIYGLGQDYRWLAVLYAVCLIAAFGFGFNAFQGNTVAGAAQDSLGIDRLYTGVFLAVVTGFIVYGGIKRIAMAADVVVPVMAVIYVGLALLAILVNLTALPGVIWTIFANAFGFEEAVGGGIGAAVAQGLRRGLFSNEAGLGSAPNVAATAYAHHPVGQGIVQSLSVFIDTIIICSATAFMVLLGDAYVAGADIDGIVLVQDSLRTHFGEWAQYFLTMAILLFAFSSIIYNYYLGENALTLLTETPAAVHVLRVAIIAIVFIGSVAPGATAVFFFSDPLMGLLAMVNLLAVAMLFPVAMRVLRDYEAKAADGTRHPVFDPSQFADLALDKAAWDAGERAVRTGAARAQPAE